MNKKSTVQKTILEMPQIEGICTNSLDFPYNSRFKSWGRFINKAGEWKRFRRSESLILSMGEYLLWSYEWGNHYYDHWKLYNWLGFDVSDRGLKSKIRTLRTQKIVDISIDEYNRSQGAEINSFYVKTINMVDFTEIQQLPDWAWPDFQCRWLVEHPDQSPLYINSESECVKGVAYRILNEK
jgi:hypothetical protein